VSAFTPSTGSATRSSSAAGAPAHLGGCSPARAIELLDLVGIPEPAVRVDAFPHEYSGGMRQGP